eukprot:COSAG02_NODE_5860_length_3981_cov_43.893137_1_plen_159_part_00
MMQRIIGAMGGHRNVSNETMRRLRAQGIAASTRTAGRWHRSCGKLLPFAIHLPHAFLACCSLPNNQNSSAPCCWTRFFAATPRSRCAGCSVWLGRLARGCGSLARAQKADVHRCLASHNLYMYVIVERTPQRSLSLGEVLRPQICGSGRLTRQLSHSL